MASGRSKLSSAKSLPDLHRARIMPLGSTTGKEKPGAPHKNARKPPILAYREDQYSSKVLTGTWQERRTTDLLPKVPFQDAYMLDVERTPGAARTTEVSTYQKNFLRGRVDMNAAVNCSYQRGKDECLKNKTTFNAEAADDVYRPAKGTTLHDQGAAWHSLYHQSYTLRNPKTTQLAAVETPEIKYGLWEKHLAKWEKIEADERVVWKSTYQMGFPLRKSEEPEGRKFVASQWRTGEGNLLIGNPHAESQKELGPSVGPSVGSSVGNRYCTAPQYYGHHNR